ncbi:ABC transporter ATP-binding protein [Desemzia sp. RIT804]|uniref:ABC transporter ATP-binding protein n=1 Tax=Desemzia sp. RIT 804 TaxID=2810209 RepID=UPI0019529235|nr:ABC transporter ATP-binding protein [Desemzia sp. RIT 804]MBM6615148.1 ABC transporter ATP-binding protein [Desemzia sp. RIT 804]
MIQLLKYLKAKDWGVVFMILLFIVAQVFLDLKLPDYMSEITMMVQTPGSETSDIIQTGGYMMLCALGSLVAAVIVSFFATRLAASFAKNLRERLFDQVEDFSMQEINGFSTSSLITRSTNDITQVQMFIAMGMQILFKAPIMAVWALTKISNKNWQWTAATGVTVVALLAVILVVITLALPRFKRIQKLTDNLTAVTRENLTGIRVVRAYNAEEHEEGKFETANTALNRNYLFTTRAMALMSPSMIAAMNGLSLAIYWIGAYLINNTLDMMERITIFSDMVVFSSYAIQVVMSFVMLTFVFVILPRAQVSANRIKEVLNTPSSIKEGTVKEGKDQLEGEIEFRNVSFKYPDASDYVIKDIDFVAHKGETVAFIGSTGSGKSTILNLVPRFYDPTEGEILVDGVNIKDYTQEALRNKIGYVPQKAVLFSGTIASNVAFGDNGKEEISKDAVKHAISVAKGTDFVEKTEDQYEGHVAQGGNNFSGGQKQRLAIARAIARDPEIFIFDDSFSALDYKTDRELRSQLKEEAGHVTNLIVGQRIGTIKDADTIIVLDEGRIVGKGKHRDLLETCEVYREIAYSQLSEEELANE